MPARRFTLNTLVGLALLCANLTETASADRFVGGPLPVAPDVSLPRNHDHEPAIAVAPDGTFWIASDIGNGDPRAPLAAAGPPADILARGSDVWRSTDGGRTYQWIAAPFNRVQGQPGPLSGGDTDIAVATAPNRRGHANVYVASLYASVVQGAVVGDVSLAISQDGGQSWLVDPVAATVPSDDRPWLTADGACRLYLTYHALPTTATVVNRFDLCNLGSDVSGTALVPVASSRYVSLLPQFAAGRAAPYVLAGFGKTVADTSPRSRYRHRLYIPAMDCAPLTPAQELSRAVAGDANCPGAAQVYVQVSANGGRTWTLRHIASAAGPAVPTFAAQAAVSASGTVYIAWFDNHHVYLDTSRDGGVTWSSPRQVDTAPVGAAAYPTVAAGPADQLDIAFYGTDRTGEVNSLAVMGLPATPGAAGWRVYLARSNDGGATFSESAATGIVHTGAVCTNGDACAHNNTRDLLDDFGIATSPLTGRPSIAYTSDQPQGTFAADFTGFATMIAP